MHESACRRPPMSRALSVTCATPPQFVCVRVLLSLCVLVMVDEVGVYARDRASVCALVGLRTCAPVCVVRWQRCACEPACTMHSVCKSVDYRILSTVRIISTMNCAFRLASTRRAACTRSLRIPSRSAFLRRLVRRA